MLCLISIAFWMLHWFKSYFPLCWCHLVSQISSLWKLIDLFSISFCLIMKFVRFVRVSVSVFLSYELVKNSATVQRHLYHPPGLTNLPSCVVCCLFLISDLFRFCFVPDTYFSSCILKQQRFSFVCLSLT